MESQPQTDKLGTKFFTLFYEASGTEFASVQDRTHWYFTS